MSDTTVKRVTGEDTISMRIANRKARADRESPLNALETFANLGETPEDWKRFRLKCPEFFPEDLTEWFYLFAEHWATKFAAYPEARASIKPPLLFYQDCLRRVWTGDDPKGINLKLLLGFEREVKRHGISPKFMPGAFESKRGKLRAGTFIPGQPVDPDRQTTVGGLPPGRPIVDGVTGAITWVFGCTFQQSVFELMPQRWRAMVCPECKKYFLADKTRQRYCSSACFGDMKRKRALDYWNRKGSAERDKRRAKQQRKS